MNNPQTYPKPEKCPCCHMKVTKEQGWDAHRNMCSECSYEIYKNSYGGM